MIKLNVPEVLKAAKKALDEGRLAAFRDDVVDVSSDCLYTYESIGFPDCVCAVGAGFTPEDLSKFPSGKMDIGVRYLAHHHRIVDVDGDLERLSKLQELHDGIMDCKTGSAQLADRRKNFVEFLDQALAEAPAP